MKNKHLRNDYHIKFAEAEMTPGQLVTAHTLSMQAIRRKEAENAERAIKSAFVDGVFAALNLTKYR